MSTAHSSAADPSRRSAAYMAGLALAALGVVYGDLGTSPLYALRETFHAGHGVALTRENIYGAISLILWSLVLVISLSTSCLS